MYEYIFVLFYLLSLYVCVNIYYYIVVHSLNTLALQYVTVFTVLIIYMLYTSMTLLWRVSMLPGRVTRCPTASHSPRHLTFLSLYVTTPLYLTINQNLLILD